MNVKLNMLLAQLPEVDSIDVFPSCGDESNIFGAGFHLYNKYVKKKVACLNKYTLGPTPSKDLVQSLTKYQDLISYQMVEDPNSYIADQLSDNKIVARCTGEMEFGARALGNRSILADPRDLNNVNKINRAIKLRDFWMPFAPAILWDHAEDFLEISDSLQNQGSPYMMFAFDTVEENRQGFMCGIHQADFTARAQTVTEKRYPDLYSIIKRFYESTGVPGVLNTSFNLHGFPIVHTSDQAIAVLLDSEIDVLVIDNCAIKRAPSTVETDC